ncbi:hypothetical protein [Methylocystis hirsuta]|uniref:Uncharacterized protein n=1 Tax=Methylocystis hirsuta TaxID=369798 RepID=A0A3M9XMB2_9HYPH|nr:hypothetical protein [Methylocystis hirsuta]RNJ49403.1 hypothetical protein D1O30_07095 [Methylocystis hirsuta]
MQNSVKELDDLTNDRLRAAADMLVAADNVFAPLMATTILSSRDVQSDSLGRFENSVHEFVASLGCMSTPFLRKLKETVEAHIEEAERIEADTAAPAANNDPYMKAFGGPALIDPLVAPFGRNEVKAFSPPQQWGKATNAVDAFLSSLLADLFMPPPKPTPTVTSTVDEDQSKPLTLGDILESARNWRPPVDKQLEEVRRFYETVLGVPCTATRGPHHDMINVVAHMGCKA